jgi:hypothetical protein
MKRSGGSTGNIFRPHHLGYAGIVTVITTMLGHVRSERSLQELSILKEVFFRNYPSVFRNYSPPSLFSGTLNPYELPKDGLKPKLS